MGTDRKVILIGGGSGLIGKALSRSLAAKGHDIRLLSRDPSTKSKFPTYIWDIKREYVDPQALEDVDVIVNLAGASIVSHPWTKARKRILSSSRIDGNALLLKKIKENLGRINQFIGASAIGFYGNSENGHLDENSRKGEGYMAELCAEWEDSQTKFKAVSGQVATVRIGLVLSNEGGVLSSLRRSIVAGIGAVLGSGQQFMSWIHIDDLIQIFHTLVDNPKLNGVVNGVAPNPVIHRDFMKQLVARGGGLNVLVPIPEILIRTIMGERSQLVLDGAQIQPKFMLSENFEFKYRYLEDALTDLVPT